MHEWVCFDLGDSFKEVALSHRVKQGFPRASVLSSGAYQTPPVSEALGREKATPNPKPLEP